MSEWDRDRLITVESGDENADTQNYEVPRGITNSAGQTTEQNSSEIRNNNQSSDEPITYTSQLAALLIIVNVTVGAGLLAMPYAMQMSGLIPSIIIQLVFLILIIMTCIIITELTVKTNVNSFHRIVEARCHPYVFQFTQISLLLFVFVVTVAFIVIVGDQADRLFADIYDHTFCYKWYMNRRFIMSAATVFLMKPLCSAKTVEFLKYASFLGVASLGFVLYVVTSKFIEQGHVAKDINYLPKSWIDVGAIVPVFCLGYQCHLSWVPVVATMKKEQKYTSYFTITAAMIIASVVYMVVCILAMLTLGSSIKSDLTESYSDTRWPILTTIGLIAFKCVVTLPPAFLPLRLSLIDILSDRFEKFNQLSEPIKRFSVTYFTLTLALLLALFVPDILVAVDILGCLAVMFIFTLPGLSYLHLIKENRLMKQQLAGLGGEVPIYSMKDKIKMFISWFFIIFGTIMTFVVLYKSISAITEKSSSQPLCYK